MNDNRIAFRSQLIADSIRNITQSIPYSTSASKSLTLNTSNFHKLLLFDFQIKTSKFSAEMLRLGAAFIEAWDFKFI